MVGDVEHNVPRGLPLDGALGDIDGVGVVQARRSQIFPDPQAVKLQPHVLPGLVLVRAVGVHLARADEKALVRPQVIAPGYAVRGGGVQKAPSGDHVVEEKMVADKGAEGVEGGALLPSVLVQPQIQEIFVGENREGEIVHRTASNPPAAPAIDSVYHRTGKKPTGNKGELLCMM